MYKTIEQLSRNIRIDILTMINKAHASHIGAAFSVVDILSTIYFKFFNKDIDKLILSKGHAGAALYAALAECGYFSKDLLNTYCMNNSYFSGHISNKHINGVTLATGSLGHGLPVACGLAYSYKLQNKIGKIFVILGDGQCQQGTTWQSLLFAAQHKLNNLVIIIDKNNIQALGNTKDILSLEDLLKKFNAFNCYTQEINGHNFLEIQYALNNLSNTTVNCIIANTIKGKGVSFMQNNLLWHYKTPTDQLFNKAMIELKGDIFNA